MSIFVPQRGVTPRSAWLAPGLPATATAIKAGPVGPGAGVLNTEFPLSSVLLGNTPQQKMRRAYQISINVPWIRAAERVISGDCSTVEWHLEDGEDVEIDDEYPGQYGLTALQFIEKPQATLPVGRKLTRRELWALTFRHMGICGTAFWYLDQLDLAAKTPAAALYIRPDRMTPDEDANGNLQGWWLDKTPNSDGIHLDLNEVVQFNLEPPDSGHFGTGLVESAIIKAQNSTSFDQHVAQVLSAGGRLSGIVAPKVNDHFEPDQYIQLVNDMRTVVEQPDAAKRVQVMRGPVDFTPTTMTIADLQLRDMMQANQDQLLALWGVPPTQIGMPGPSGMNSGDTRKYDRQALWEHANHPRIVSFVEALQYQALDRWADLGQIVELEIEEPAFEDEGSRFDLLLKSLNLPMRNWERRSLIGYEPFGPDVINPETGIAFDDEVWLPNTQQLSFVAPEDAGGMNGPAMVEVEATPDEEHLGANPRATAAAGETTAMKAAGYEPEYVFGRPNPNYSGPKGTKTVRTKHSAKPKAPPKKSSSPALKYASGRGGRYRQISNARAAATFRGAYSNATSGPINTTEAMAPPVGVVIGKATLHPSQAALLASSQRMRREMDMRLTPRLRDKVSAVLAQQRTEIGQRVKAAAAHLLERPGESSAWWGEDDSRRWDRRMREAMAPELTSMAEELDVHLRTAVRGAYAPRKAGPVGAVSHALDHAASRITGINDRTRAAIVQQIRQTVAEAVSTGASVRDTADMLDAAVGRTVLDNGESAWDPYRAELIARTELMGAYNAAALGSYTDLGASAVMAVDGVGDEECAERNGNTYAIDAAESIEDHPNGTLDWVPVVGSWDEGVGE